MGIMIDNQYSAAALHDGGWRSEEIMDLAYEFGLTDDQARELSKELAAIEAQEPQWWYECNNGNGGILIRNGDKWAYLDACYVDVDLNPYRDGKFRPWEVCAEILRAVHDGKLLPLEDLAEYCEDPNYAVPEYAGCKTIGQIDRIVNYETTDCGDRVLRGHDLTTWEEIAGTWE